MSDTQEARAREVLERLDYVKGVLIRVFNRRGYLRDGVLASNVNVAAHRLAEARAIIAAEQAPSRDADEMAALNDMDRPHIARLHQLQHDGTPLAKPKLGGSILAWAADEIAASRAAPVAPPADPATGDALREACIRVMQVARSTHGNVMQMLGVEHGQHFAGLNLAIDAMEAALASPTRADDKP